jgi:hypothetical protein
MKFEVVDEIAHAETILPSGNLTCAIPFFFRQLPSPYCFFNKDRSRMPLPRAMAMAEIHWYEAHGIGKVKIKVK